MTAVLIAIKYYDDQYYDNNYYSKIGGISCSELNRAEAEFLSLIDYNLYVEPSLFFQYQSEMKQKLQIQPTAKERRHNQEVTPGCPVYDALDSNVVRVTPSAPF